VKDWGESVIELMIKKNNYKKLYTVLSYLGVFTFCTCCILICLVCIVASFKLSCVYCCYLMCVCCFCTLDAGLLARSQYSEGPATGHPDRGFSCFSRVYKQMLRWFPTFQVATTCFSCSPPDLNSVVTDFIFCIHVK